MYISAGIALILFLKILFKIPITEERISCKFLYNCKLLNVWQQKIEISSLLENFLMHFKALMK